MRLQYIGGGEKALEALRVQNRPALVFAGLLVHVLSVLRVYYDQLFKHLVPTVRNRGRPDPELEQLRKQVQRRDGWQCQFWGSRQNLRVHHKQLRSQQGSDDDLNLITLCADCHEGQHRSR